MSDLTWIVIIVAICVTILSGTIGYQLWLMTEKGKDK